MKRTSIRRKAPKRTPVRDEYAERFAYDEIYELLGLEIGESDDPRDYTRFEINHIFTNPRRDWQTVLIGMTLAGHRWFHRNLAQGRVLCLIAKRKKRVITGDFGEFDLPLLRMAYGKPLSGLVDSAQFADGFLECGRRDMLAAIASIERGERA